MISINQVKNGMGLLIDGEVNIIQSFEHVKPGKGSAFVRIKIKNMKTLRVIERTYRSSEKLEDIFIESRSYQFLYATGEDYFFMDHESYEQVSLPHDVVGDADKFLKENMDVTVSLYNNQPITLTIPVFAELKVVQAEPGVKGDTAKGGTKPVELETGAVIQVPLFITTGDVLKIDTRSGEYVERVSK